MLERLLVPDTDHVVDLPDEVRWSREQRDTVRLERLVIELQADEPLACGEDQRVLHRMERALGERRERAHLFDLVSEELDPERLATRAREDVDEASANRDLPTLLDAFHTLVAGERELLDEGVETAGLGVHEADDVRAILGRRHSLGERAGGHADDPSAREDVERAGALTDEVRGGQKPGTEADTAAREESDELRIEVPADGLRNVASVLVLGKEADEGTFDRCVQCREEERKRRLGDARIRRERVRERAEALALGELVDEAGERCRGEACGCLVHAAGGNGAPLGDRSARPDRSR